MEACPFHGDDLDVSRVAAPLDPGGAFYRCAHSSHGRAGHVWAAAPAGLERWTSAGAGGVETPLAEELGLYDLLPTLFEPDGPWLEYGIVERYLREAEPTLFGELVRRFGHIEVDQRKEYTASAYIAHTLGQLTRPPRGPAVATCGPGPATGFWSYNTQVFYWRGISGVPTGERLTFADWADANRHDPTKP